MALKVRFGEWVCKKLILAMILFDLDLYHKVDLGQV